MGRMDGAGDGARKVHGVPGAEHLGWSDVKCSGFGLWRCGGCAREAGWSSLRRVVSSKF